MMCVQQSRLSAAWLVAAAVVALATMHPHRANARSVDSVLSSCLQHVGESTAFKKVRDGFAEGMTGAAIGDQGAFVVLGQLHDACKANASLIDALDAAMARCRTVGVTAADLGYLRSFEESLAEAKTFRDQHCGSR